MKHIYYISSSTVPSRSANSIHTINMTKAFEEMGYSSTIFVCTQKDTQNIYQFMDICRNQTKIIAFNNIFIRGVEIFNAFNAVVRGILDNIKNNYPSLIISRNLYGAFLFNYISTSKVIYEFHAPEKGIKSVLQRIILKSKKISSITISESLKRIIIEKYNLKFHHHIHVVHDAAREIKIKNDLSLIKDEKLKIFSKVYKKNNPRIGYFGHLYEGRGIQLIRKVALLRKDCNFFIFGGNELDIEREHNKNSPENFYIMGHIPHDQVGNYMMSMDILLMPYERKVGVGVKEIDTSKWMSPLKLFEYMSSSKPIISSDLPVLREIIKNNINALLVNPTNAYAWSNAINYLCNKRNLRNNISYNNYKKFLREFTWTKRVRTLLDIADA